MQDKVTRNQILSYYSDDRIASEIFLHSKGREVAGALMDGSYDKRPNMLQFKNDISQMARKGITSFHYSVERWSNPMAIAAGNQGGLRTGWDMVIDIDSKLSLNESKTCARIVCDSLGKYGIKNHTVKFSGRRGFHIILPWEMFPKDVDYVQTSFKYPEIPRIIAGFMRDSIKDRLMKELLPIKEVRESGEKNPFRFVEVEKDWGSRHMFRAPYSFNEKTWLVSLPINPRDIERFEPESASHQKVLQMGKHESIMTGEKDEAANLLLEAMDWNAANKKEEVKKKPVKRMDGRISEEFFPPCIKIILSGMKDGRKRSIFTLINFLKKSNWKWGEIEQKVYEWNDKNSPPLPRSVVASQLKHAERREASPPANCSSDMYYADIGICAPDEICGVPIKIKNPINYPYKRMGKSKQKQKRGVSCICGQEFPDMKSLTRHKSKSH